MTIKRTGFIALATAIVMVVSYLQFINSLSTPKEEIVEKHLSNDNGTLVQVAEYLSSSKQTNFRLVDNSGYDASTNRKIVSESSFLKKVEFLFDEHEYKEIRKEANTVRFVRWTRVGGFEAGLCYVPDGSPKIEYLTIYKALSMRGWYYYEADYNQWRVDNY